jgi:hypothetical protein
MNLDIAMNTKKHTRWLIGAMDFGMRGTSPYESL